MSDESVRVTTVVGVDPDAAWEVFTDEVDQWWRRGPRFRWRPDRPGVLRFEPGVGGRLVEEVEGDPDASFEVGRIHVWEPGARLVFDFRARSFEPGQSTRVEIRFEPDPGGTRVTVEHSGWDGLPKGHPARHGLEGPAFDAMMGVWWGDLLVAARRRAER